MGNHKMSNVQTSDYTEVGTAFGLPVSFRPYSHEDGADFDAPGLTLICHERADYDNWSGAGEVYQLNSAAREARNGGGARYDIEEGFRNVTAHDNETGGSVHLVESVSAGGGRVAHYLRPGYTLDQLRRAMREALTERADETVAEWSQANPEANPHLYDRPAEGRDWERQAREAVLDAWEEGGDADDAIKAVSRFE